MSEEINIEPCDCGGCAEAWVLSCHHGRWCGAHVVAHQQEDEFCRKALAQAELKLYQKFFIPVFRLRDELMPVASSLVECVALFGLGFCEKVSEACRALYESEGEPLGSSDEAMWRWLEERLAHAEN